MRIKTLEHIHNLLKSDLENNRNALDYISGIVSDAIANNQDNVEFLKEQKNIAWNKWNDSRHHLEYFEDEEF